ncbi:MULTISPECIES: YdhK family protein [unclassified Marinobacter]|jgi:hypothetical protein|uniref:YdhK family protein n=1 Tax=unclassified Marinobacter TaxID=83889 RepID=UPI0020109724|nr:MULTISPECIES: YdhK family protein [unclassified Marinobacter]UQG63915.1 YdhK family protein [Marinobacter sp. M2C]UQG68199.1 YdhK family protein [Marinobacter sp. M1C]
MKKQRLVMGVTFALVLSGCEPTVTTEKDSNKSEDVAHEDMKDMVYTNDGIIPNGLMKAEYSKYIVGSEAIIQTDHMEGMKGATATIVGAFYTTAYSINYTPTDGSAKVLDHKWVIHEEIENPASAPLEEGTEVTVLANHMKGMEGAKAEIESAEQTTVYMIDYFSTTDGNKVTNHKWVVEDELSEK